MIHPTAIVSPKAGLAPDVEVGPWCLIGDDVTLGPGCRLHSHVVIEGPTVFGSGNEFFPFAVVGGKSQDLKYAGEPTHLEVGDDNVFRENCTVHRGSSEEIPTRIGSRNHFLAYSHVGHDCQIGDHVILSNNGTLGGHVLVGDYAIVGGLTAVHQFCRVGEHSMIGGCSRIIQDIPPFMIVSGNPALTRGFNKIGLERRGFAAEDLAALRTAYKRLFLRKDANLSKALEALRTEKVAANPQVRRLIGFIESSERGVIR